MQTRKKNTESFSDAGSAWGKDYITWRKQRGQIYYSCILFFFAFEGPLPLNIDRCFTETRIIREVGNCLSFIVV